MLMCRMVLHVYCFPLQHVSDIMIFYPIVFQSIMKHGVLRELHTALVITSNKSIRSHIVSQTATLNAIYSASTVLKATDLCFLLHQETMLNSKVKQQLNVLFRSTIRFAQSISTYPCKLKFTLEAYLRPYPIVPRIYLNKCFIVIQ
jgi:hypothetical protein